MKRYRASAWPADWILLGYCALLAAIALIFRDRLPRWPLFALGHVAVAAVSVSLVLASARRPNSRAWALLRGWDALALIPALFFMVCGMIHHVNPHDQDAALIAIDRAIGGIALLNAMDRITWGWLTDLSKALWIFYYFLPLLAGIPLWCRRDLSAFREAKSMLVLGWALSYVGYLLVPAEGPGYHAERIGVAPPRWEESVFAVPAKAVIDALEQEARDTFPSGHAVIAGLVGFLLLRHREWAWAAAGVPLSAGVVLSTIYLRYHYVTDVLVGLLIAGWIAVLWEVARRRRLEMHLDTQT
ncbi:MAG: phosphatase PAP2 family protein [Planctomycetes bacterium]|nr:phosphatase PAP2 family protein [Planctomycetota bacterium]